MSYLFFDTETTGLPDFRMPTQWEGQPRICQLGAILTDDDGKVRAEMNLIASPSGWKVPYEAAQIHGITQDDAIKFGVSMKGILTLFSRFISKADVVVAHNIRFDAFMIEREVLACEMQPADFKITTQTCTMEMARDVVCIPPTERMIASGRTGFKSPNLMEAFRHFFGRDFDGAHDAMADVRACKDIFFAITQSQKVGAAA